jgi:hypothetical protein
MFYCFAKKTNHTCCCFLGDGSDFLDPLPAPRKSSSPVQSELEQQQDALDALARKPVNDRTNAKLAAKQFEALVNKMKEKESPGGRVSPANSRGPSPIRERPLSVSGGSKRSFSIPELVISTAGEGEGGGSNR